MYVASPHDPIVDHHARTDRHEEHGIRAQEREKRCRRGDDLPGDEKRGQYSTYDLSSDDRQPARPDTCQVGADRKRIASSIGDQHGKHHAKAREHHACAPTWSPMLVEDSVIYNT